MKSMIIKILRVITRNGITPATGDYDRKFIIISNVISLMAIFSFAIFFPLFKDIILEINIYIFMIVFVLVSSLNFVFNYYRLYDLTIFNIIISCNIFFLYLALLIGWESGTASIFFVFCVFSYFYIPFYKKKSLIFAIAVTIVCYFFLMLYLNKVPPVYFLSRKILDDFNFSLSVSIFGVLIIYGYYFAYQIHKAEMKIIDERNALKSRNKTMEHELVLARNFHEQLVPASAPADYIHFMHRPLEQVGGDFFDFIRFRNSDRIGIFISDVSGHGVAAAFITSMLKAIILQSGERKGDPAQLLHYINEILYRKTAGNFITALNGVYDPGDNSLVYSSAGHHPPLVVTRDEVTRLEGRAGMALALLDNSTMHEKGHGYENSRVILPAGTKLLLYTDGLTETRPVYDDELFFEYASLDDTLKKYSGLPCNAFVKSIFRTLVEFRGDDRFEDDVCMICIDVVKHS